MDVLRLIGGIASSLGSSQGLLGALDGGLGTSLFGSALGSLDGGFGTSDGADPADVLASSVGSFLGGGSDDASSGLDLFGTVSGLLA